MAYRVCFVPENNVPFFQVDILTCHYRKSTGIIKNADNIINLWGCKCTQTGPCAHTDWCLSLQGWQYRNSRCLAFPHWESLFFWQHCSCVHWWPAFYSTISRTWLLPGIFVLWCFIYSQHLVLSNNMQKNKLTPPWFLLLGHHHSWVLWVWWLPRQHFWNW